LALLIENRLSKGSGFPLTRGQSKFSKSEPKNRAAIPEEKEKILAG